MERRGAGTRRQLVETAERLFAERGIEAVSLRDVCAAAGQRNHSAAQYHFGDRAGLLAATFEHRMGTVNAQRHALLTELEAAGRLDDVAGLVAAIVVPLVDVVAATDGWYGRFLARTQWDSFATDVLADLPVLSSFRRTARLLAATMPALPPRRRASRLDQLSSLVIGTVGGWEWQRHRGEPHLRPDELAAELVATGVAVLRADLLTPSTTSGTDVTT